MADTSEDNSILNHENSFTEIDLLKDDKYFKSNSLENKKKSKSKFRNNLQPYNSQMQNKNLNKKNELLRDANVKSLTPIERFNESIDQTFNELKSKEHRIK